jgi:hypothetical protein
MNINTLGLFGRVIGTHQPRQLWFEWFNVRQHNNGYIDDHGNSKTNTLAIALSWPLPSKSVGVPNTISSIIWASTTGDFGGRTRWQWWNFFSTSAFGYTLITFLLADNEKRSMKTQRKLARRWRCWRWRQLECNATQGMITRPIFTRNPLAQHSSGTP